MMRNLYAIAGLGLIGAGVGLPGYAADNPSARGAAVYGQHCAQCHGPNMVRPVSGSADLRAFPVDQHDRFINSVINGKRAMPAWKEVLSRTQSEDLWVYVQAARRGPAGLSNR